MKQSVFAFLLLSGLCALRYGHSQQYHFVETPKHWTEAQRFCRENYTDLVTIDNQTDARRILNQAQRILNQEQSGDTDAWIGLHRHWQWSLADRGLYTAEENFSLNWATGEPNNNNRNENCATMRGDGRFHDFSCDNLFYFICYNESSADKYIPIKENKTWEDARCFCRKKHTDLVNIKNQTENNAIMEKLNGSLLDWWIGLSKDWKWSDLSESSYPNWSTERDGNLNCIAVLLSSGKWAERNCDTKKPFFCYEDNLILVQENKTWDEALEHCRRNHDDLVSVSTETVEHWVRRRARNATTAHVWLGVRYSCALQVWHWVSGEVLCPPSWASEDRGRECGRTGAIEPGGGRQRQVSLPKTERLNFICSKRLG